MRRIELTEEEASLLCIAITLGSISLAVARSPDPLELRRLMGTVEPWTPAELVMLRSILDRIAEAAAPGGREEA